MIGCKSVKKEPETFLAQNMEKKSNSPDQISTGCPENGECSWEYQANTSLQVKEDTTGALYPVFTPKPGVHVLKYTYTKKTNPNYADSGYKEVVLFEITESLKEISISNDALTQLKVTYGRLCYCRGATGYVRVTKGSLDIAKENRGYSVNFNLDNGKYPQIANRSQGFVKVTE